MENIKKGLALLSRIAFSFAMLLLVAVLFLVAQTHELYAAVLLFLVAQFSFQYILTPLKSLQELILRIGVEITFNENNLYLAAFSEEDIQEKMNERALLQKKFRTLACELEPTASGVLFYWLWAGVQLTPSFKNIQKARAELIGLSNSVYKDLRNINKYNREEYQHERVRKIRQNLGLPDPTGGDFVQSISADAQERLIPQEK